MLETSKDLLWLALAFVIVWIGLMIGWGGYYIAMILRDVNKITGNLRKKMDLIDAILKTVKDKVEKTANYLPPLVEGVSKLVEYFKDKKPNKKDKKKKEEE